MAQPDGEIAVKEAALAPLLKKFPEATEKLQQLFQQSPSFQSLCEDYLDCQKAFTYWCRASSEEAPKLSQSYAELLQELEQEVREFLEREELGKN